MHEKKKCIFNLYNNPQLGKIFALRKVVTEAKNQIWGETGLSISGSLEGFCLLSPVEELNFYTICFFFNECMYAVEFSMKYNMVQPHRSLVTNSFTHFCPPNPDVSLLLPLLPSCSSLSLSYMLHGFDIHS